MLKIQLSGAQGALFEFTKYRFGKGYFCGIKKGFLLLEAVNKYFCKFTRVDEILEVVDFRAKEAGSKDHCQIISAHFILGLLADDVLFQKH